MTTSKDLMLAILAMDSYNRGYGAGLGNSSDGLGGVGSQIGDATLTTDSTQKLGLSPTSTAGFYAAAYKLGITVTVHQLRHITMTLHSIYHTPTEVWWRIL